MVLLFEGWNLDRTLARFKRYYCVSFWWQCSESKVKKQAGLIRSISDSQLQWSKQSKSKPKDGICRPQQLPSIRESGSHKSSMWSSCAPKASRISRNCIHSDQIPTCILGKIPPRHCSHPPVKLLWSYRRVNLIKGVHGILNYVWECGRNNATRDHNAVWSVATLVERCNNAFQSHDDTNAYSKQTLFALQRILLTLT